MINNDTVVLMREQNMIGKKTENPTEIAPLFRFLENEQREILIIVGLNCKLKIIYAEIISVGCTNATIVDPKAVFRRAILDNAISLIALHNHPSGDCEPSEEDDSMFVRLRKAGNLFNIKLVDSVIIAKDGFYGSEQEKYYLWDDYYDK